jgi:hypothetical protein
MLLMVLRSWDTPAGISALAEYMGMVRGRLKSISALKLSVVTVKKLTAKLNEAHEHFHGVQCGLEWARDLCAYLVKAAAVCEDGAQFPDHQLPDEVKQQSLELEAPTAPTLGFLSFIGRTNTVRYWVCSTLERVFEFSLSMHNLRAAEIATAHAMAAASKATAEKAAAAAAALDEAIQVHASAMKRSMDAAQCRTLAAQHLAAIPDMSNHVFAVVFLETFTAAAIKEAAAEQAAAGMVDKARCHSEAATCAASEAAATVVVAAAAAAMPNTLPKTYPARQLTLSYAACANVSSYTIKVLLENRTVNAK